MRSYLQTNHEANRESNCGLLHKVIHAVQTEVDDSGKPVFDPELIMGVCVDLIFAGEQSLLPKAYRHLT